MKRGTPLSYLETAILLVIIATISVSVTVISRLPFRYRQQTSAGKPYIEAQDTKIAGIITSIAMDESHIYCCWGKRHVVKVYDLEGQHVSTIAISDKHNKGGTLMVFKEDQGVVLSSDAHSYYFENGNFVSFDPQGNHSGQRQLRQIQSAGNTYTVQRGSVIRTSADGVASSFVSSPPILPFMTRNIIDIVVTLLLICLLIVHTVSMRRKA